MNTSWNDAEEDALHGLPWISQLIYLRGLRRFMDYRTGVVGIARGVSRQSLTEVVYVEHVQGRHTPKETSDKAVRAAIEALIRAGLIERMGDAKRLIFRMPLADSDEFVRNMRGRRGADEGPTKKGREESSNDNVQDDMRGRRGAVAAPAMKGPPPYTVIREEEPSNPDRESGAKNPQARGARLTLCTLPVDWFAFCRSERPDLDPAQAWERFHDYWVAQPGAKGTKTDWLATWRNWVRRESKVNGSGYKPGLTREQRIREANTAAISAWLETDRTIEGTCLHE
jgi:hypothetical protein